MPIDWASHQGSERTNTGACMLARHVIIPHHRSVDQNVSPCARKVAVVRCRSPSGCSIIRYRRSRTGVSPSG
ncbi:hypothetical protein EYF80_026857 [Liparis tanakae]|uniref:Uncharacterized protein n=1 Tax=Liparis tanakae TaxID=230148 RepID=A0A4Z2HCA0_9TELE|nr:hypothetical protein EYF80_026857 [Liparis tanakae]